MQANDNIKVKGLLPGGTAGQVLVKNSNAEGDYTFKDTTDRVRPNSHALVESGSVYGAINEALSSVYTPRGDLTCAELTSALLTSENVGSVYEMSDSGTTSALFINGAGITISPHDNVGVINAGPDTYLFNYMGNAFDLTNYQKKDLESPIAGASTVEGALSALDTGKQDELSNSGTDVNSYGNKDVVLNNNSINIRSGLHPIDIFPGTLDGQSASNMPASYAKALYDYLHTRYPSEDCVCIGYCHLGIEYSVIVSMQQAGQYGSVVRFGYQNTYAQIIRKENGVWKENDWVNM